MLMNEDVIEEGFLVQGLLEATFMLSHYFLLDFFQLNSQGLLFLVKVPQRLSIGLKRELEVVILTLNVTVFDGQTLFFFHMGSNPGDVILFLLLAWTIGRFQLFWKG